MARAIIARRKGDNYQARFFWLNLLKLRINDFVENVTLEIDDVIFVDDVVIKYNTEQRDSQTGYFVSTDYFQCKYHITQNGAFSSDNLIDPKFINSKSHTMIEKLHKAYTQLRDQNKKFRLYLVSNWFWHPEDILAKYIEDEFIRRSFFDDSKKSSLAKFRESVKTLLKINDEEFQLFIETLRFRLGMTMANLLELLEINLKMASLKSIDSQTGQIIYDDLTWKLYERGENSFDKGSFDEMIKKENLIDYPRPQYSEVSIYSFAQYAHRPRDIQSEQLDLTNQFKNRFPVSQKCWKTEVPQMIDGFINKESLKKLSPPIYLFFDCHLSIAFYVGAIMSPKYGLQIVPAQKSTINGYEFWEDSVQYDSDLWKLDVFDGLENECVIGISVTNRVEQYLLKYLNRNSMENLYRLIFEPIKGIGPHIVSEAKYAWSLGQDLKTKLKINIPSSCQCIHMFYSGPAALAYILGNTLQYIVPEILLYEYDFEGQTLGDRYYPSIKIH